MDRKIPDDPPLNVWLPSLPNDADDDPGWFFRWIDEYIARNRIPVGPPIVSNPARENNDDASGDMSQDTNNNTSTRGSSRRRVSSLPLHILYKPC